MGSIALPNCFCFPFIGDPPFEKGMVAKSAAWPVVTAVHLNRADSCEGRLLDCLEAPLRFPCIAFLLAWTEVCMQNRHVMDG